MTVFFVVLCIVFLSMQTISLKMLRAASLRENILQTGAFCFLIGAFWCAAAAARHFAFSAVTVGYAALFSAFFVATIVCYYYAMQTGPLSYTSFFFSASMIIPSLAGILIWKEPLRGTQAAGIGLFLAAAFLICVPGSAGGAAGSRKWRVLCALCWFLNGSLSVIAKAQQIAMKGEEAASFMTVSYSFAFLLSAAVWLLMAAAKKDSAAARAELRNLRTSAVPLVLLALGTGVGNYYVTWLSSRVPGAYLYPVVLGGILVAATLYSAVFLREKISRSGAFGLAAGMAALVVLNL